MAFRIVGLGLVSVWLALPVHGEEAAWKGKVVLLARAGVKLELARGEKIGPKTAGAARDLTFQVLDEKAGRLRISSRRQLGWIAKSDAVLFDRAVAHFTKKV